MLRADVRASMEEGGGPAAGLRYAAVVLVRALFTTRLQAVVLLRLSQAARSAVPSLAYVLKWLNHILTGCDFAAEASVGPGLILYHPTGVVVGPDCVIGEHCVLMQGVTLGVGAGGSPTVGDHVFVGPGAKVFGAVRIGSRSHIGANAVVMEDVPRGHFAAGVPARIVKRIYDFPDEPASAIDHELGQA
ncbi:MAG: hypothetical protein V7607_744 [Solirubrobacteraceae bacterium]